MFAHTATTPELLWVVAAVAATLFTMFGLTEAILDQRAQQRDGRNGGYAQIAADGVRRIWARLAKLIIILILGVDVASREASSLDWRAYANTALAVICFLDELGDWVGRRRLEALTRKRSHAGEASE